MALYAAIAGANVATMRAELMGVLVVAAVLLDRPRDWLAPLAAAARWRSASAAPGALCEISFQLSFVAVLAIVLGMPRLTAWWNALGGGAPGPAARPALALAALAGAVAGGHRLRRCSARRR